MNWSKIIPILFFISIYIFSQIIPVYAQDPVISAEGAVLIDVDSNRILYSKNPGEKMRIASLTKIMTAIVAIENGNLTDTVKISDRAYGVEGSSIYLRKGEKLSLEDMLYGLMLRSGNDAATAIAEHIGGSVEGFVFMMNEKAAFLGMENTHFRNPHGLDQKNQYSTPRDMAILTAYALKNPVFKEIVSTKVKTVPLEGKSWDRKWYNKNKMLYKYQWADGVKTGYTSLAKRCLASSATKNGKQIAIITLSAPDDWNDHIKLFEYGFNNFEWVTMVKKGEEIQEIRDVNLLTGSDFSYPLKENEKDKITRKIILNQNKEPGRIEFYFNNKFIGSVPIIKVKNQETE